MRRIISFLFLLSMVCLSVSALTDFTPSGNIDMRGRNITNATRICLGLSCVTAWTNGNNTFNQSLTDSLYLGLNDQRYNDTLFCSNLVSSVGNWSADKNLYATVLSLNSVNNTQNTLINLTIQQVNTNLGNFSANNNSIWVGIGNKSSPANCAAGYAVQNTTIGGVQCVNLSSGPQGIAGSNGTNGLNGSNGLNGTSVNSAFIMANGSLNVTLSNGTQFISGNLTGTTGPQGNQGVQGTSGTNGINGLNGTNGINGTNASVTSGDIYINVSNGMITANLSSFNTVYVNYSNIVNVVGNWSLDKSSYATNAGVTAVNITVNGHTTAIGNLQTANTTLNSSISNANTAIINLQNSNTTLNGSITNANTAITNLQTANTSLNASIANLQILVNANGNFSANNASIWTNASNQQTAINNLQTANTTLNISYSNLQTTIYYPSLISTITGTAVSNNTVGNVSSADGLYGNWTEVAGSNALDIRLNFTNVTMNFTNIQFYGVYLGTHQLEVQLWDYANNAWEQYYVINPSTSFVGIDIPVFDAPNHINVSNGSIVQLRIDHLGNGQNGQITSIDEVQLQKGIVISGSASPSDSSKLSRDGSLNMTGNLSFNSGVGLNASFILNPPWTTLSLVVANIGNFSANNATSWTAINNLQNANTTALSQISSIGNWSLDKSSYSTTAQDSLADNGNYTLLQSNAGGWVNSTARNTTMGNFSINQGTNTIFVKYLNSNLTFTDASDPVVTLTDTDRMGISTATPTTTLDVNGSVNISNSGASLFMSNGSMQVQCTTNATCWNCYVNNSITMSLCWK